jgi:ADP-heptose:LPS heptosyltransferase
MPVRTERSRDLFRRLRLDARILLIRLRSMGDCLLLTSPLRALMTEFPSFRVSVLVEHRFADIYDGNPDIAEIIRVRGKAATVARLLTMRFDAVVNLHGGPTSRVYALSARGRRIGGAHHQHARLYSATYPPPNGDVHTAQSTLETFRWFGVQTAVAPSLRYEPHGEAAARIASRLEASGVRPGSPYVVVHPAAVMETKRWPADRFAALITSLQKNGFQVALTCGPGEEALVSSIERMTSGARAMPGLTIPELAELIRAARGYIGNDSGPMHLATAVGTPTIAIWGSSSSVRWHPWGVERRVVQNPFSCNPCPGYRCLVASSPLCIESVTVAQVEHAVQELLRVSG